LIDSSNHFNCLLIDDFVDGGGTTAWSCFDDPRQWLKAKFDRFTTSQVQHEDHFATEN